MVDYKKILTETNPVFVLFLGATPAVALSGSIKAALGIGVAALVVMLLSSVVMGLVGKNLTEKAHIAATVLVSAFFVSVVQMLMGAFLPKISATMGIYLAVLATNLMVFGTAGREAATGELVKAAVKNGLVFLAAVLVLAGVRVLFGSGMLFGFKINAFNSVYGGLILFAIELAVINAVFGKKEG